MATGYYIHEPIAEWEAVDRWENEGGRLGQHHQNILDSIGKEYMRHTDQAIAIERLAKRNEIRHAMVISSSDKAKYTYR